MLPTVETLIIAVEKADSANGLLTAVENLAAAKSEAAIPTLTDVLRYNNPGASVAAVDGLIAIGKAAVPYLLANLDGYNYGARAWATRALAGIGDVRGLDLLLEAAVSDFSFSVRRGAARGLGNIIWSDLEESRVSEAQNAVFTALEQLLQGDTEWVVRYAAIVGLEGLGTAAVAFRRAIRELLGQIRETEAEIVVKLRADQALEHLQ
ncbi:MAG: HEAT repeat domain-containing protein [Microcystis aeruginosa Ma_QC_Ch_20071001_S25]|jgi:phycocyanobilin lyase beta subunit|uniref:HEAT repeat domain-containing protein n=2 Tax=Microcystis aeruginosa TaxID=1126 RepID=A0A552FIQ4_MICAE|nr:MULTISPECIES: HEAT repeat domain-containing protein [unclassified Microcystis]MCA2926926.1 HEAT repeat domain-containing protein [Microcystis sp. M020S1]MCA2937088.1 HEAT repeat domain-containing protein [Microcystis sp. M015S1]NCQ83951.1 HEAT repeat domain-containing protein [Microcystis aeruginosa W13-18]NCR36442.1 HEAT repeat domain-containing protein [Microcystis aeruginosa S11-05]NCR49975.1 HEAT repeat domain-containing protein [Microcystis aeruginosa S11-01]NCR59360.1 HEAT repeat dom